VDVVPAHTSSPPAYRSKAAFWAELLKLDDGQLHFWYGLKLGLGIEVDVLLLDISSGAFGIEVCNLPLSQITHMEIQSLVRKDGVVSPSPLGQALGAAHALGSVLDKTWEERPDIIQVAAFPLISRVEWMERFQEEPAGEFVHRCVLKDDLTDLEALRNRLQQIAEKPVGGRPRSTKLHELPESGPERMDEVLFGAKPITPGAVFTQNDSEDSKVLPLLDEVVELVKGPGSAYHSPGLDSLTLWRTALSHVSDRLRISVVGEFKSGKSSLINAILGQEVCYVDEFEATSISATYTDGASAGVSVLDEQNGIEEWSIPTFLERCANKELGAVRRVVVSLPTDLPFDIVDSPGLGSNTRGHSTEAEMEIRRTDLLLWTVDGNDAGSAREGAFIQRAREIRLPIIVLLTKTDLLEADEVSALVEYVANESGVPKRDIIPVSAHEHISGKSAGVTELIERLKLAARNKMEFQGDAYAAKLREAIDGSRSTLRFLIEINAPHARFLATERGYLETSALGIGTAAKAEWLRVLREECSAIASSIASKSIEDADVVELMLRKALPGAVNRATTKFLQSLSRLVRDEWRGALEEKSREFETRLGELLVSRPDAKADLEFLRSQSEAFRIRAEVIHSESEPAGFDNRLLIVGLGAAASVLTVSILPIAVAGVVAAVAIRQGKANPDSLLTMDAVIAGKIEGALLNSFDSVSDSFERAIDRIVTDVAVRSLIKLVKRRGGPDFQAIVVIQRNACDLMDELTAVR